MKKLLLAAAIVLSAMPAYAQVVSKGSVQRLTFDNLNSGDFTSSDDVIVGDDLTVADDAAITDDLTAESAVVTRSPTADSATTNRGVSVILNTPVDTTGTNTHSAFGATLTIGNATGGTNTVNGYVVSNVTGDAQVDARGLNIGTGTVLGSSFAIKVNSGWDEAIDLTLAPAIDGAQTVYGTNSTVTVPAHTTGTNTLQVSNIGLTVNNATGGTNQATGWNFANYTGDAQVNVTALAIGTSDGLGTANAITVGTGWDLGLQLDSGLKIGSTNGTAITSLIVVSDAVANGQTSKTTTVTGATSSSKCFATPTNVATNSVFIRAVVAGTNQAVITTSGDPGASTLTYNVLCLN